MNDGVSGNGLLGTSGHGHVAHLRTRISKDERERVERRTRESRGSVPASCVQHARTRMHTGLVQDDLAAESPPNGSSTPSTSRKTTFMPQPLSDFRFQSRKRLSIKTNRLSIPCRETLGGLDASGPPWASESH
jgi:hypothetical protein